MARNLAIYLDELKAEGSVGLEGTDERLIQMIDSSDKGRWAEAADRAEDVADQGIFDIRAISFVLYAAFREDGIAAIQSMFDVLAASVGKNFAAIGPERNRAAFFDKRIVWLFGTVLANLEYYKKLGGAEWQHLQKNVSSATVREAIDHSKTLVEALAADTWNKSAMSLGALTGFLRSFAEELDAQATAGTAAVASEDDDSTNTEPGEVDEPDSSSPAVVAPSRGGSSGKTITLSVSHQFLDLLAKLRAFEVLIEKGEHMKAAVVADDLNRSLENFDPRAYFPDLLSRFSQLMFENANEIEEQLESRDSFAWQTSVQFYRVDMKKFVHGERK